jgi:hypothetical protein
MIVIGSVILQDSIDLLEVAPGSEVCETSSQDGNEVLSIKVEDVPDNQEEGEEEEDPLLITFPVIKNEHEVSHACEHSYRYCEFLLVFYHLLESAGL